MNGSSEAQVISAAHRAIDIHTVGNPFLKCVSFLSNTYQNTRCTLLKGPTVGPRPSVDTKTLFTWIKHGE